METEELESPKEKRSTVWGGGVVFMRRPGLEMCKALLCLIKYQRPQYPIHFVTLCPKKRSYYNCNSCESISTILLTFHPSSRNVLASGLRGFMEVSSASHIVGCPEHIHTLYGSLDLTLS
jgi:hypothetical protein